MLMCLSARGLPRRAMSSSSAQHCTDLVKRRDYEGFLATLLLPHRVRRSALALRAFNVETSSISDSVRDRTLGLMRMQFWLDTIEAIAARKTSIPNQPVVKELARAVAAHNLSTELLTKVVKGRERFLSDRPFSTAEEVDDYGKDCFSSLNYLILESVQCEEKLSGHLRHAANQLGMAQGIVTLLRGVAYNASKRKVFLPVSLMTEHSVSAENVIRGGQDNAGLSLVVEALAARAQDHLENCRFRGKYMNIEQKLAMLPAVCVDSYLGALHTVKCDVFSSKLQQKGGSAWLPALLYYHKFKRTF